ncbi:MAG: DUF2586 family protein [Clostridiaceae bacterium]|nr:DUF2586 family protein [Clostridiaceae bacterium]
MRLPDARINIQDGGLGILPPGGRGVHAKIGVCAKGQPNQIIAIGPSTDIVTSLGSGPLTNAIMDSRGNGSEIMYVIRIGDTIDGSNSAVTADKAGGGSLTVEGKPLDAFSVKVEILQSGGFNEATFRYSLDGGNSYSSTINIPSAGQYELKNTGLTLKFEEDAVDPEESFKTGDLFSFKTTAPEPTVEGVIQAVDMLLGSKLQYEAIHVVGESNKALWVALDAKAMEAEGKYRYIQILAEAKNKTGEQTTDQWAMELAEERQGFASTRVAVALPLKLTDLLSGRTAIRNGAGIFIGRVTSIRVSEAPGKVKLGALSGVQGLWPEDINEGHITLLDSLGYITFRNYIGLEGTYITNGNIMAENTSDFQRTERRRTMDRACQLIRARALQQLQEETEGTDEALDADEAHLESALDTMVADGDIVTGRVSIPRDQDLLATEELKFKVAIMPKAIKRFIEVDVTYENPLLRRE